LVLSSGTKRIFSALGYLEKRYSLKSFPAFFLNRGKIVKACGENVGVYRGNLMLGETQVNRAVKRYHHLFAMELYPAGNLPALASDISFKLLYKHHKPDQALTTKVPQRRSLRVLRCGSSIESAKPAKAVATEKIQPTHLRKFV